MHQREDIQVPRPDMRANDTLRPVKIVPGFMSFAEGSALIEMGLTKVIVTATLQNGVPQFLRGSGRGWLTAEYSMLPRSTPTRTNRESVQGRVGGRTHEIQRLIGRSLRAVTNLSALGERTILIDCDVIQADGGTRTAAITGSYVALHNVCKKLVDKGALAELPLKCAAAAVSVGIVNGEPMLDLCYVEDSQAEVDFNIVMTSRGEYIELQGTAEGKPFSKASVDKLLGLASKGIYELFEHQTNALKQVQ